MGQLADLDEEGHTLPGSHNGAEGGPIGGIEDHHLMGHIAAMGEGEEQEDEEQDDDDDEHLLEAMLPEEEEEEGRRLLQRLGARDVPLSAAEAAFQELQSLHPGLLAWGDDRMAWE